ncbi:MAG: hypothetical protein CBC80_006895 [Flavobacteriaceae bacterium TMED120]|nr:MAG: hypothetical protein CBC80_006895 [Flavobacteriaceae bacterium TMED120]
MYNTALRITNDVVLAEEATQEGFILAFRKLHQFEKENSFGGWLKKMKLNLTILPILVLTMLKTL